MKAGTKYKRAIALVFLLIGLLSMPVTSVAEDDPEVPVSEETLEPSEEDRLAALLRQQEILRRETFFHFFKDDFLSAATYLRLLEDSAKAPHNPEILNEARLLTGSLYLAWGMHRPATQIFNELVDVFPPGQDRNRLLVHVERAQYERALYQGVTETYGLLSREEPFAAMHQAAYFAGMSHYALGQTQEALVLFKGIAQESVYFPYAKLAAAKSYLVLNEGAEAVRVLRELSGLSAENHPLLATLVEKARLTLGQLLIEQSLFLEASAVLSTVPEKSPFYPDALFAKGWASLKNNNSLQALLVFEDLIQWNPTHRYAFEALTGIAHAYNRLEVYQTALEHYDRAIQVYAQEETRLRTFQAEISDERLIPGFIASYAEDKTGPLKGFVEGDETLLFWLKQYAELSSLNTYLENKLDEVEVFNVVLAHREKVFSDFLVQNGDSVQYDALAALRQQGDIVFTRLLRAYNLEQVKVLASAEEQKVLVEFGAAQRASFKIGEALVQIKAHLDARQAKNHLGALEADWKKADRWVGIVAGEAQWKHLTELPERADDLRGRMKSVLDEISLGEEAVATLRFSVPRLELEFQDFRRRIEMAGERLNDLHGKNSALQADIILPFRSLLLAASERKLKGLAAWRATAELSQIRILDRGLSSDAEEASELPENEVTPLDGEGTNE